MQVPNRQMERDAENMVGMRGELSKLSSRALQP